MKTKNRQIVTIGLGGVLHDIGSTIWIALIKRYASKWDSYGYFGTVSN